ncbi:MAG: D-3-phosphoglycerate dehydrogenase / 2-oxoglutarate reductase, partial [Mycobacterium sp.]|nr:D-3-phosphoglycerate dehydrogenase / 2-oxoglutarate reductase [Mycobacterium sp.]
MTAAPQPRLVFERWTDPLAGDILEAGDIGLIKLDLGADSAAGWAALQSAHGYQVATRTDVTSVADGQ